MANPMDTRRPTGVSRPNHPQGGLSIPARNAPTGRISIAFDDQRLVASAGLLLPVTLAHHLGLGELVESHVDLGDAPGRANAGDKLLTLVGVGAGRWSACGGHRRRRRTARRRNRAGAGLYGEGAVHAGHVPAEFPAGPRAAVGSGEPAGAGASLGPRGRSWQRAVDHRSGFHPPQADETYGLSKAGARQHGYTGQRGYHPLFAVAAGTGDVLTARPRKGRPIRLRRTRGAANFLRENINRVGYAGATGPLTMRADSGFYIHPIVAACRKMKARFSITVRQHPQLHNLIEAIPEADWTPIPYWMEGGTDVVETICEFTRSLTRLCHGH